MDTPSRRQQIAEFEFDAEWLALEQLDLIAQIEAQLRLVRETMHEIERLRQAKSRVGPEPTNGERGTALSVLTKEITGLNEQIGVQGATCRDMLATVERMHRRLTAIIEQATKRHTEQSGKSATERPSE